MTGKMLKKILLVLTLSLTLVFPTPIPSRADGDINWQKGWTWTNEVLMNGPYSEITNSARGFLVHYKCTCNAAIYDCTSRGGWICEWPWPGQSYPPDDAPEWFDATTNDGYKQFSVLHLASGHHSSQPYIEKIVVGGNPTFHLYSQLFYSGSPYSAVGKRGDTIFWVINGTGRVTSVSLLTPISHGEYRGIGGLVIGDNGTLRHGAATSYNTIMAPFGVLGEYLGTFCSSESFQSVSLDRGIPLFRDEDIITNETQPLFPDISPVLLSRAGYVFGQNNEVILPESFGITDEEKRPWAEFGEFSSDPLVTVADTVSLRDFEYNNRSFEFVYGLTRKIGSNVSMIVSTSSGYSLTVKLPPLKLYNYGSTDITYHYAVGVASKKEGKYFVAYTGNQLVRPTQEIVVNLPDIVIPQTVIQSGDTLTVRAVVVGDRGDTSKLAIADWFSAGDCGGVYALLLSGIGVPSFAKSRTQRDEDRLGFLPVVHTVMGRITGICGAHGTFGKIYINNVYVRYVGDVAQASVHLVPISLSISGSTDVYLGMNIQGAKQFWPNGSSFVVSTDVPLHPSLQFHPQLSVSYTITNASGVITGTATIEQYQVKGSAVLHFNDGVWFFGTRTGGGISDAVITFSPSRSPYTVPLITHREGHTESCSAGITDEVCDCIAFNIPECYHVSENNMKIRGGIRVRARVSVPLPDGTVMKVWSPWSPTTNLYWKMFLQQERR